MNPAVLASSDSLPITIVASFLVWLMFAGLVYLWVIDGKIKKEQALHALFASLIAWGFGQMLKTLFPTLRPFEFNGHPPLTLTIPGDGSFPSTHAAIAFAIAGSIFLHDKKIGLFFAVMAILVALGRVLSNVHTLFDVVFGASYGLASSYILKRLHVDKLLK